MPETSILIPTYNNPKALLRAVESCLLQKYIDWEIIIADDSTNNESENLYKSQWNDNSKIKYFHNKVPLGSPKNWNYAISKASGDYIKFLHHDDWFTDSDCLEKLVSALNKNPDADFAYCQSQDISENNEIRFHDYTNKVDLIRRDIFILYADNYIGAPSATIYRKNDLYFDERLRWLVDIDFYIRILLKNEKFIYIPDICLNIGISSSQITNSCLDNPKVELFENFYFYKKYKHQFKTIKVKLSILKSLLKKYKGKRITLIYVWRYIYYKLTL